MKMKYWVSLAIGVFGGVMAWSAASAAWAGIIFAAVGGVMCLLETMGVDRHEKEKRRAAADAQKQILDQDLAQGVTKSWNGKEWKAGCQIDPETSQVIYPQAVPARQG